MALTDPADYLTLEKQFCRLCWSKGERVKVWDWAVERRTGNWKLRRRNAAKRHIASVHPEYVR